MLKILHNSKTQEGWTCRIYSSGMSGAKNHSIELGQKIMRLNVTLKVCCSLDSCFCLILAQPTELVTSHLLSTPEGWHAKADNSHRSAAPEETSWCFHPKN